MRPPSSGVPAAVTAARVLVATALALLAAGAGFMFMYLVVLVSGRDGGETTYPNYGAFLLALAGVVVSSCVAISGLGRASPRPMLAGAAGLSVAAAVFMGTDRVLARAVRARARRRGRARRPATASCCTPDA